MLLVTQLDDLSPLYWDFCIDHLSIFPTSREHKNIVQFCTSGDLAAGSICQSGSPTTCWWRPRPPEGHQGKPRATWEPPEEAKNHLQIHPQANIRQSRLTCFTWAFCLQLFDAIDLSKHLFLISLTLPRTFSHYFGFRLQAGSTILSPSTFRLLWRFLSQVLSIAINREQASSFWILWLWTLVQISGWKASRSICRKLEPRCRNE